MKDETYLEKNERELEDKKVLSECIWAFTAFMDYWKQLKKDK